jgi:hypothetical protein
MCAFTPAVTRHQEFAMNETEEYQVGRDWERLKSLAHARNLLCDKLGMVARTPDLFAQMPVGSKRRFVLVDGRPVEVPQEKRAAKATNSNSEDLELSAIFEVKQARYASKPSWMVLYSVRSGNEVCLKEPYFVRALYAILGSGKWYQACQSEEGSKESVGTVANEAARSVLAAISEDERCVYVQDAQGRVDYLFHSQGKKRRVLLFERLAEDLIKDEDFRNFVRCNARRQLHILNRRLRSGDEYNRYMVGIISQVALDGYECTIEYADDFYRQRTGLTAWLQSSWTGLLGIKLGGKAPRRVVNVTEGHRAGYALEKDRDGEWRGEREISGDHKFDRMYPSLAVEVRAIIAPDSPEGQKLTRAMEILKPSELQVFKPWREGANFAEIAELTGLFEIEVREIFNRVLEKLRKEIVQINIKEEQS